MVADPSDETPTDDDPSTGDEDRRSTPIARSDDSERRRRSAPSVDGSDADRSGGDRSGADFTSDDGTDGEKAVDEPAERPDSTEAHSDDLQVPEPRSTPVRPEGIDVENAAFVVLGAVLTIVILAQMAAVAF